jgi:general secretion pathway protein G
VRIHPRVDPPTPPGTPVPPGASTRPWAPRLRALDHRRAPARPQAPARSRAQEAGFTLVELLVVLVILGLVMGLVGPRVLGYLSGARERTMRLQIESFAAALDLYYLDLGRYPSNAEGLEALVRAPASAGGRWAGPDLKQPKVPEDPWGNPNQYHTPGRTTPYTIVSLGPDGKGGATSQQQADTR